VDDALTAPIRKERFWGGEGKKTKRKAPVLLLTHPVFFFNRPAHNRPASATHNKKGSEKKKKKTPGEEKKRKGGGEARVTVTTVLFFLPSWLTEDRGEMERKKKKLRKKKRNAWDSRSSSFLSWPPRSKDSEERTGGGKKKKSPGNERKKKKKKRKGRPAPRQSVRIILRGHRGGRNFGQRKKSGENGPGDGVNYAFSLPMPPRPREVQQGEKKKGKTPGSGDLRSVFPTRSSLSRETRRRELSGKKRGGQSAGRVRVFSTPFSLAIREGRQREGVLRYFLPFPPLTTPKEEEGKEFPVKKKERGHQKDIGPVLAGHRLATSPPSSSGPPFPHPTRAKKKNPLKKRGENSTAAVAFAASLLANSAWPKVKTTREEKEKAPEKKKGGRHDEDQGGRRRFSTSARNHLPARRRWKKKIPGKRRKTKGIRRSRLPLPFPPNFPHLRKKVKKKEKGREKKRVKKKAEGFNSYFLFGPSQMKAKGEGEKTLRKKRGARLRLHGHSPAWFISICKLIPNGVLGTEERGKKKRSGEKRGKNGSGQTKRHPFLSLLKRRKEK